VRVLLLSLLALSLSAGCGEPVTQVPETSEVTTTSTPMDPYAEKEATVYRVSDGDTVDTLKGKGGSVRVLGIDSPETVDPSLPVGPDGHRVPQCGGPESTQWARAALPVGTVVRLVPDRTQAAFDRFDPPRQLAYIRYKPADATDWLDFSVESARAGMSRSYVYDKKPVLRIDMIRAAEDEARQARRGLWNCPENLPA
jgi:micrococcal nuclease